VSGFSVEWCFIKIAERHEHDVIDTRTSKQCLHSARSHDAYWFTKDTSSATMRH